MIRIVTDSAADFEPIELEKMNIVCVPLQVTFGEDEYKENINLTKDEFYTLLREKSQMPKTSQPTPFDFEEKLSEYKDNGEECVVITLSSGLSGTYKNVLLVKEMLEYEDCYVIDSLNAVGGQRLLVEHAVKMRDEGKSAPEIAKTIKELSGKITLYACIDTLEYLHKGGRLSAAAYAVGSLANIKPIITFAKDGTLKMLAKTLSMKLGISAVCKNLLKDLPDKNYPIYALYSHNRKNAENLVEALKAYGYEIPPERIVNVGAAIGSHVGEGACGVVYIAENIGE